MLTGDKIISIYCIVDDILKGIKHKEDSRRRVSDSEIITTALVSALYFPNIFLSFGACFLSVESLILLLKLIKTGTVISTFFSFQIVWVINICDIVIKRYKQLV